MRLGRVALILLAIYLVFIGGSAYYALFLPVRILHHALITLLLAIWLIRRLRQGIVFPSTPLNSSLYAAVIIWFVSAAVSDDPRMAFEHLWFPITHLLMFFVLVDLFQRGRERVLMETQFMLGAGIVLLSGIEIASWYFGLGIIPDTATGWIDVLGPGAWLPFELPRLSLALNVSTLLAGYVAPLVTITAAWAATTKRRDFRTVLWMLAGMLLVILLLTVSRGGILSLLAAGGVFAALRLSISIRLTQRISPRLIAGAAAMLGIIFVSGFLIYSITEARSNTTSDDARLDMWRSAIEITRDHPLLGVGPGLFGRTFRDYRDPAVVQDKLASAHNVYLNTAAETGLVGIIMSLWLGFAFVRTWLTRWRGASGTLKTRLAAAFGALIGLGVHSLVDTFTVTPIVLLIALLAGYCLAGGTESPPLLVKNHRFRNIPIIITLIVILSYELAFIQFDRAQTAYERSFASNSSTALADTALAVTIDPALQLYRLQTAYLSGLRLPNAEATSAYERALALEPTWDTGWINLAELTLRSDNPAQALEYLGRARQINSRSTATLHWARIAEEYDAAPADEIVTAYVTAMQNNGNLPLAEFWSATDLRRRALDTYLPDLALDDQYRVLVVHDAERAYGLVPSAPSSAVEWWVAGEYALTVGQDTNDAAQAFSEAILLAPNRGDYYASRARATLRTDPESAERDLKFAELLGTYAEYPNAIRAEMASDPEEIFRLRASALPPQPVRQEFAAVLYGRPAVFELYPAMRRIGPGRDAMQPWYAVADERLANGQAEDAIRAYRAIIDYAPDEQEARDQLTVLGSFS